MDNRLSDVLNGKEENYLYPFYWQQGNHTEKIPSQIQRIYDSGCRALCVESRTHNDFCGDGWWRDMDMILSECQKRNMQVWVLDDKHFPTGYANGALSEHPELRPWTVTERHIDVIGPMNGASVIASAPEGDVLLGAYAYRRTGEDEKLDAAPICLTENVKNGLLYWDIPTGCYRIFFFYKTRRGTRPDYIDMISEKSAELMLEYVYEPHFKKYKEYFGKTLCGFFSDEPCFGNERLSPTRIDYGFL